MKTSADLDDEYLRRYGKWLAPEKVAELKNGEIVTVIWSGGNGPHRYAVRVRHGQVDCELTNRGVYVGTPGPCDRVWRNMTTEEWIAAGRPHWKCAGCERIYVTIPIAAGFTCPLCTDGDAFSRLSARAQ